MPGRHPLTARAIRARRCTPVLIVLALSQGASAEPARHGREPGDRDVEATASVTLERLSVGLLRVDRPWNPGICIGCDGNNRSAYARLGARRAR
ncbi:hypothetical protein [Methylobacterium aerolatum]|uniref:Uncharacterized protein n=1 Tax=Methylobacterium aerolatum TaxID=418708 RepID=A0ABU0HZJ4_9HYPH|nr:hypothetical protein [Methylobacterium aerolatum]MDQ0447767.1 hypothetical protein [Methylobacterium aerolatum]GJD34865.1 hypothetical protein FMGBMHLM_1772 [Methylobacterium aerolatum]